MASFERVVGGITADVRSGFEADGLESVEVTVLRADGLVLDAGDAAGVSSTNLVDAGWEVAGLAVAEPGASGFLTGAPGTTDQIVGYATSDGAVGPGGEGWGVIVAEDLDEALAELDGIRSSIIAIGGLLLLVVAALGLAFARSVADPLRRIAAQLALVADGDLTPRLREGTDEVGRIAAAVNTALDAVGTTMVGVDHTANELASSAADLSDLSQEMADTARSTSTQASDAAAAAEEITVTSDTVSRAMDQMSASVREISDNTAEAAEVSSQAVQVTVSTRERMRALENSASDIGNVVNVITSIAEQTDLLALNATIEAARVGEDGKGFAVVANEVKALASQTSTATDEIRHKVEAIQQESVAAVQAIADISALINKVNEASTTIAGAVEQQSATTQEVTANLQALTQGTTDISASIASVAIAAGTATDGADRTERAASHLTDLALELNQILAGFRLASDARAAGPAGPETAGDPIASDRSPSSLGRAASTATSVDPTPSTRSAPAPASSTVDRQTAARRPAPASSTVDRRTAARGPVPAPTPGIDRATAGSAATPAHRAGWSGPARPTTAEPQTRPDESVDQPPADADQTTRASGPNRSGQPSGPTAEGPGGADALRPASPAQPAKGLRLEELGDDLLASGWH
ncbi:MAG: methyl-accepting chemotaxis protein [Actinomycetota bacterium]